MSLQDEISGSVQGDSYSSTCSDTAHALQEDASSIHSCLLLVVLILKMPTLGF